MKRAVIGRFDHPLLRELESRNSFSKSKIFTWGSFDERFVNLNLNGLFRLPVLILFLFRILFYKRIVFHFVRKDFIVLILPVLLIFNKEIVLFFWGSDTKYPSYLYRLLVKYRGKLTIRCSSSHIKERLIDLGFQNSYITHFPSPNAELTEIARSKKSRRNSSDTKEVVIGNNGRKEQRHLEVIEQLRKWNESKTVSVVHIPYSYMPSIDKEVLRERCLKTFPRAEVRIYSDSLSREDLLSLYTADYYFNMQEDDALSTFLVEMLYAGVYCYVNRVPKYSEFSNLLNLKYLYEISWDDIEPLARNDKETLRLFFDTYVSPKLPETYEERFN